MNSDNIEVEIVVLSGKWKFSLSSFIKLRQGATEGHYKVNWNATMDTDNGRVGIGIVVQDFEGYLIAARSLTKMANLEPVTAETLAAHHIYNFGRRCANFGRRL